MDKAGNIRTVKANVNIGSSGSDSESDEEEDYGNSGEAYEIAQRVMSNLWRDNDVETARAIFNWVHSNVYYQSISFFQTYEAAAYRGFTKHNGDCYVSYACAKMLLDCAGIKNMMVERYPVYQNGHYWNLVYLNGNWYHCDATVFRDHPGAYFMCTDDEIGDYHHDFNGSLYPERAGGSSEYRHEPEVTVTPTPVPTVTPTVTPTAPPTVTPTVTPAAEPTDMPSPAPSVEPDVTPVPEQSDVPAPAADGTGIPETLPSEESAVPSESHEASTETNVSDTDVSDAFGANDQMVQSNPAESTN